MRHILKLLLCATFMLKESLTTMTDLIRAHLHDTTSKSKLTQLASRVFGVAHNFDDITWSPWLTHSLFGCSLNGVVLYYLCMQYSP